MTLRDPLKLNDGELYSGTCGCCGPSATGCECFSIGQTEGFRAYLRGVVSVPSNGAASIEPGAELRGFPYVNQGTFDDSYLLFFLRPSSVCNLIYTASCPYVYDPVLINAGISTGTGNFRSRVTMGPTIAVEIYSAVGPPKSWVWTGPALPCGHVHRLDYNATLSVPFAQSYPGVDVTNSVMYLRQFSVPSYSDPWDLLSCIYSVTERRGTTGTLPSSITVTFSDIGFPSSADYNDTFVLTRNADFVDNTYSDYGVDRTFVSETWGYSGVFPASGTGSATVVALVNVHKGGDGKWRTTIDVGAPAIVGPFDTPATFQNILKTVTPPSQVSMKVDIGDIYGAIAGDNGTCVIS